LDRGAIHDYPTLDRGAIHDYPTLDRGTIQDYPMQDRGTIHDYHLSKVPWRTARLIGRMLLQQAPRLKKGFIAARGPNNTISMYG
jgi:hypothetical protein